MIDRWLGAARWLWNTSLDIRSEAYRECRLCLRDQDRAFGNFFAHRARHPKFKPRRTGGSLRFQDIGVAWSEGIVRLPKLGALKLAEDLPGVGKPDMVTLSKDAVGRYFVSFSSEIDTSSLSLPIVNRPVGVDLGLNHLATLSTGEKIRNPKRLKAHLRYLRQQQRCLARRQKGSKRREKQRLRVAKIQARIRQARQAAIHTLTSRLSVNTIR